MTITNAERSRRWREKYPERNRAAQRKFVASKASDPEWHAKRRACQRKTDARPERRAAMRERNLARHHARAAALTPDRVAHEQVLRRDPCSYCGARGPGQVDHIVAVGGGGSEAWDNLTAACKSCNARKATRSVLFFLAVPHGPLPR